MSAIYACILAILTMLHVPPAEKPAAPAPERRTAVQRADRGGPRTHVAAAPDDAFWRRLANCESPTGRSGTYLGYFQLSRDTARKVGYRPGMTYEQQRELAKKWLAMIGGRGGTRAGWPVCWWRALG